MYEVANTTVYGYARVSRGRDGGTDTLRNKRMRLTGAGVDAVHMHQDTITGTAMQRPGLHNLLEIIWARCLRACLRSLQYVKLRLLPEGVIMSHSYSSDISREQFARILPYLESARRRTKPRTVDLYDVFCGVLYLLKSGCQWRMLPADFPDWRTCYKYFRQWSERPDPAKYSILEQVLKKIG